MYAAESQNEIRDARNGAICMGAGAENEGLEDAKNEHLQKRNKNADPSMLNDWTSWDKFYKMQFDRYIPVGEEMTHDTNLHQGENIITDLNVWKRKSQCFCAAYPFSYENHAPSAQ